MRYKNAQDRLCSESPSHVIGYRINQILYEDQDITDVLFDQPQN